MLQEKFITINNIKLFYLEDGQGQPLLFLHGGGLRISAGTYHEILLALAGKYHVIAPDIPGFGNSDIPVIPWDFSDYASFFDKFLEKQNLDSVTIVGHSFGGGVALLLSVKSTRISQLVLVDSTGLKMSSFSFWRLLFSLFKKTVSQFSFKNTPTILKIIIDFFTNSFKHFWYLPKVYRIVKKSLTTDYPQIRKINSPTLLLWGEYDNLFPLETARRLNNQIKNSRLEIIKGGHDWCLFEPELFVKKIEDFIS